jgi:D-sedoheptulose 7-phosphate isomerase
MRPDEGSPIAAKDGASEAGEIAALFQAIARDLKIISQGPYVTEICRATKLLASCFSTGGKLLVFGNGGSSADAQHICAELVGRFQCERKALPAIALSANQAILTAWSNDYSFDTVFSRQIEALGRAGDVAWGISTSGNSRNVIEALKVSRERGLRTIGLTGKGGGRMAPWCDVLMSVPLAETARIQEVHVVSYHAICAGIERRLVSACTESIPGSTDR